MSEEQRKAASERMKAMHAKKKREQLTNGFTPPVEEEAPREVGIDEEVHVAPEQGTDEILRQLKELQESNALLKAALLNNQPTPGAEAGYLRGNTANIGNRGGVIGVVEKYLVDPANYPDPTERLSNEPRLQPMAFNLNYEMDYSVSVSQYENKGINYKEPKFQIKLNRVVLDDQGEATSKRYIARQLVFHEDPQAALVIARDNGVEVDRTDEKKFLDEMRYLRVRDWLFDIFWPKPTQASEKIKEEVIGGRLVQVFTKNSEDTARIDYDKISSRML